LKKYKLLYYGYKHIRIWDETDWHFIGHSDVEEGKQIYGLFIPDVRIPGIVRIHSGIENMMS